MLTTMTDILNPAGGLFMEVVVAMTINSGPPGIAFGGAIKEVSGRVEDTVKFYTRAIMTT